MSTKPTGTTVLGWCLTGHHDRCRHIIALSAQGTTTTCTCACHEGEES